MAVRSKNSLKEFFQTGFRPTESNFADLVDSFVHKNALNEDGASFVDQSLTVARGLRLGTDPVSPPNEAGTIRWNATTSSFEANTDGSANWEPLGGGIWTQAGNDATFSGGNARIGDAVMGTLDSGPFDGWAVMGHQNSISAGAFAMGQAPGGGIAFVADTEQNIELNHLGGQMAVFSPVAGIFLNQGTTINGDLTVNGNINYSGESIDTDPGPSDIRLKKDVAPLHKGLKVLEKLNPIQFRYNGKAGTSEDHFRFGLSAQDLQQVLPELVHGKLKKLEAEDGAPTEVLHIDEKSLIYILMQGIKELADEVNQLKTQIQDLTLTTD